MMMTTPADTSRAPLTLVKSKDQEGQCVPEKRSQQGLVNQRPAPHATSPYVPSERQEYKFK
jgi:hypothetical protein